MCFTHVSPPMTRSAPPSLNGHSEPPALHLMAMPAESNFSGARFDPATVDHVRRRGMEGAGGSAGLDIDPVGARFVLGCMCWSRAHHCCRLGHKPLPMRWVHCLRQTGMWTVLGISQPTVACI